ncbi:MAG: hypothetical protein O7C59_00045, partial [Rickettsia endosymbiont of Ixodes persulcatus]|nr:hypothetical protein [Rickettsia endosymbiont of Ixodes persulcatus]
KKIKADLQKINLDDLKKDSENLKKIKADLQKINENLQKVNLDDLTKINENLQKVNEDLQKIKENPNLLFEQASIQWLASIKPDLEKKIEQQDLIPIRDKHILSNGKIRSVAVQITLKDKETLDMADENSILKICESYFNKKYTFNAVISRSELLSYFDYHLIKKNENLEIVLKEKNENGEEIKPISLLACKAYEAPLFWKLTINTKEYKKLIKPNEPT